MEENFNNEYFAQKKNKNFKQNKIILSDDEIILSDDEIILSDDDTKEYNNLDKMEQFNKDYPQEEYLYDDDETSEYNMYIRNLILEKCTDNQKCSDNQKYKESELFINQNNDKKKNKKNIMKLNELHVLIDKIEEDKKPKKFVSRRSQEKLQTQEKLHKIESNYRPQIRTKRTFSPRLVPYFQSMEYKSLQNVSFKLDDFPKL